MPALVPSWSASATNRAIRGRSWSLPDATWSLRLPKRTGGWTQSRPTRSSLDAGVPIPDARIGIAVGGFDGVVDIDVATVVGTGQVRRSWPGSSRTGRRRAQGGGCGQRRRRPDQVNNCPIPPWRHCSLPSMLVHRWIEVQSWGAVRQPGSPWMRGADDNMNDPVRQYLRKGRVE